MNRLNVAEERVAFFLGGSILAFFLGPIKASILDLKSFIDMCST
jgi:hypothetical protein